MHKLDESKIAIIGLGYVGLPLAVEFCKHFPTIGFDISPGRINELVAGNDSTLEISAAELAAANKLSFVSDVAGIQSCNVYIVTVPTPIDSSKRPDLSALQSASRMIGSVLSQGDVVIYESTVYPGATEEDCAPILEEVSGLKVNKDFYLGYSPERINPGDKEHRLTDIKKVTSGSTPEAATFVDNLYKTIIRAGTFCTSSIRVAEAAKVIENTQRDINIALVNELALIFNRLNLNTNEVLEAAGTKWNFLKFRPGLVGGHCIGVDPYYLTHKSQEIGYHPQIILAGRRINDDMGVYVAGQVVQLMVKKGVSMPDARILVLGITFKENCPDVRNTRVVDVIAEFEQYGTKVDVYDPWADVDQVMEEYGVAITNQPPEHGQYDGIVVAVAHDEFAAMSVEQTRQFGKETHVLYDIKNVFPASDVDGRL
jgi:UDP-N-acetyl-D-galactosamine dehydrogenase